ncbi:MAG: ABC transporter ATP-binding protein [Anaerolineales bacterium]|nr:ABC transporter ATP-binding protein [Anaerolineales bacterium]
MLQKPRLGWNVVSRARIPWLYLCYFCILIPLNFSVYRHYLTTYLRPQAGKVALLTLVFLTAIGLELWLPQILANFIDLALAREATAILLRVAGLYLLIGLISQTLTIAETYLATDVGLTATNRLRADLARHTMALDLSFHNARTPGYFIERVDGDVGVMNKFFSRFVVRILGNAILMLGVLALLFNIDWRVGASLTGFTLVTMIVLSRISTIAIPYWNATKEARALYFGFIEERLSGTEDIRANGAVPYVMRRLAELARAYFRKDLKADIIGTSSFGSTIILFAVGSAVALGMAAWIYQEGAITLGTAYLIFGYTQLLTRPIESIIREIDDLQEAGAAVRRVNELLEAKSSMQNGTHPLPEGALEVCFENVSFAYEDSPTPPPPNTPPSPFTQSPDQPINQSVLSSLTFTLPPNTTLGLLGRTGSGKTTLTRLLFRFYDPQQGTISLNGLPLPDIQFDDLRARVGMVTQDVQLFNASVRDNLTFFDASISDARIQTALQELELLEWVESFPQGLDTPLQSGGEGLSAGEAQLLAFARVFLKDPGLIILDEASSRLDPATERLLERAITRLLAGRTAIIIAHRLGTVQRADRIMILEQGQMVEHGERMALANDPNSRFAQLLQTGLEQELA